MEEIKQEIKVGDIVIHNGKLGKVVSGDKDDLLFHPVNFGSYYYNQLEKISEETKLAIFNEKLSYIEKDFSWGKIIKIHCIGEYQFIEYVEDRGSNFKGGEILFHSYIDFKDTHRSYDSLDSAMIGTIAYKYDGNNSQAGGFFEKMISMR